MTTPPREPSGPPATSASTTPRNTTAAADNDPDWLDTHTRADDVDGEEDDDDMDYEPPTETEDDEGEGLQEVELEFEDDSDDDQGEQFDEDGNHLTTRSDIAFSRAMLLRLLGGGFQHGFVDRDDDPENDSYDDEASPGSARTRRRRAARPAPPEYPQPPFEAGVELMHSGDFGVHDLKIRSPGRRRLGNRLLDRELGVGQGPSNGLIAQDMIPTTTADSIITYDSRCYSGQFSQDGNFFFSCGKDFRVRMYDTSNPYDWKHYKTVVHPVGQWTITDASLSPNNKLLAYSSISSIVCLASTDPTEASQPYLLDFAGHGGGRGAFDHSGVRRPFSARLSC